MSDTQVIILSPETKEEHDDLISIVQDMNTEYVVYNKKTITAYRYIDKLLDVVFFLIFVLKLGHKNKTIIGVPCLRNRIVSFFLRKKFVCYMRCLHVGYDNLSSLSDKLGYYAKKIGLNNQLTNPYKADEHWVTWDITEEFLRYREAGNNIKNVGAIWLRDIQLQKSDTRRIFYITQAFAEHNLPKAHKEQLKIIHQLDVLLHERGESLILKVHPRDKADYSAYTQFKGDSKKFLSELSDKDIVISTFSTLAFEVQSINGKVKFISYDNVSHLYHEVYRLYDINFYYLNMNSGLDFLEDINN